MKKKTRIERRWLEPRRRPFRGPRLYLSACLQSRCMTEEDRRDLKSGTDYELYGTRKVDAVSSASPTLPIGRAASHAATPDPATAPDAVRNARP